MAELDFEPFSTEAFPGIEFYLSGDRDLLTLNSYEASADRKTALLSLARQGYLIRHKIPGDFTAIPPRDEGRLPLEGQEGLARRPNAPTPEARRPRSADALVARPPEPVRPTLPDLPFLRTRVRLRAGGGDSVRLEAYMYGAWKIIATLGADGRISRHFHSRAGIQSLRHQGFRMSRDGGITVYNPQRPRDGRAEGLDEEDLPDPLAALPEDTTLADMAVAVGTQLSTLRQFIDRNSRLWDTLVEAGDRYRERYLPHSNTQIRGLENMEAGLDRLRARLLEEANRPAQPEPADANHRWWKITYHRHRGTWVIDETRPENAAAWNQIDMPFYREGMALPLMRNSIDRIDVPDNMWVRTVWYHPAIRQFAPWDARHRDTPPPLPEPAIQGGGEGGQIDRLEQARRDIVAGRVDYRGWEGREGREVRGVQVRGYDPAPDDPPGRVDMGGGVFVDAIPYVQVPAQYVGLDDGVAFGAVPAPDPQDPIAFEAPHHQGHLTAEMAEGLRGMAVAHWPARDAEGVRRVVQFRVYWRDRLPGEMGPCKTWREVAWNADGEFYYEILNTPAQDQLMVHPGGAEGGLGWIYDAQLRRIGEVKRFVRLGDGTLVSLTTALNQRITELLDEAQQREDEAEAQADDDDLPDIDDDWEEDPELIREANQEYAAELEADRRREERADPEPNGD